MGVNFKLIEEPWDFNYIWKYSVFILKNTLYYIINSNICIRFELGLTVITLTPYVLPQNLSINNFKTKKVWTYGLIRLINTHVYEIWIKVPWNMWVFISFVLHHFWSFNLCFGKVKEKRSIYQTELDFI